MGELAQPLLRHGFGGGGRWRRKRRRGHGGGCDLRACGLHAWRFPCRQATHLVHLWRGANARTQTRTPVSLLKQITAWVELHGDFHKPLNGTCTAEHINVNGLFKMGTVMPRGRLPFRKRMPRFRVINRRIKSTTEQRTSEQLTTQKGK